MIQLPKVLTGYFSTAKLNSALTMIENWFNNNVVHRKNGSAVMEQDLDMNGNSIINATVSTDPSSLVNRAYVDKTLPAMEANAAQSANKAAASASAAHQSEINAAASEIAAATYEATTLTYLQEFRDTYLGSYASAPTTDPDGNPVNTGDLYFDTTLNEMRVYDGAAWKSAGSTVNGTVKRQTFNATGGETTFTIAGGYDAGYADVYLNGLKLVNGVDVDISSGTDIVLTEPASASDTIDFIAYGSFEVADTYSRAEANSRFAKLNGDNTQNFKVADAVNVDEAVSKGQLLAEIKAVDGAGSGLDADLVRGLPADFTSSKVSSGYQKLPSGLIIQWGNVYITRTGGSGKYSSDITFPITFPNACFTCNVSALCEDLPNNNYSAFAYNGNVSTSGFTGVVYKNEYNGSFYINYLAVGY